MGKVIPAEFKPADFVHGLGGRAFNGEKLGVAELTKLSDVYFQTYKKRLAADKVAAELKKTEEAAHALLVQQMILQELSAIGGKVVRLELPPPKDDPHVKNWDLFYDYILKTGDFSLLERRPGRAAIRERWDDNVLVPGVEKFPVYRLSKSEVR
jgi:hypothetical protein